MITGNTPLTSAEVLHRTGIKNAKTLTRWHQQKLIDAPRIGTHPDGRGKIAYYPAHVVDRINRIRKYLADGYGLQDAARLATTGALEAAVTATMRVGDDDVPARDVFVGRILDHAAAIMGPDVDVRAALAVRLIAADVFKQALEKVYNGENPILVVSAHDCAVTTDYGIGAGLSYVHVDSAARAPMLVFPLAFILDDLGVTVGLRQAGQFSIVPVNRVRWKTGRRGDRELAVEHEVVPDSYWRGFSFTIPERKPHASSASYKVTRKAGTRQKR